MEPGKRARLVKMLLLASLLVINCRVWSPAPLNTPPAVSSHPEQAVLPVAVTAEPAPLPPPQATAQPEDGPAPLLVMGEPAGCLSSEAQSAVTDPGQMLAYADSLLGLKRPLVQRVVPAGDWKDLSLPTSDPGVVVLDVNDVHNEYAIQRILNALLVSGFTAWLRAVPSMERHILAVPLISPEAVGLAGGTSPWSSYVNTYWLAPNSHPEDPYLLPILKLPPCRWMVEQGFAPPVNAEWWADDAMTAPDYATAAQPYLAGTTQEAVQMARAIDWLFDGSEGPDTMCGPLAWSILNDANVFPPGWGEWLTGSKAFWLASPRKNGRPWSLFPAESYRLYSFKEPLGRFDFSQFPLLPGDFVFTYSFKDGFDHMLVVTEVDQAGNVYTVTNLTELVPDEKVTIERVLLLNLYETQSGIARNRWAVDKKNGRTGHDGFDVFRWAWAEKDGLGQPVEYEVTPGDTLNLVAVRWKTPADQIAQYNGIPVDATLAVGQRLMIPVNQFTGTPPGTE